MGVSFLGGGKLVGELRQLAHRDAEPRAIRVFTFEEMHRFAKAAGSYEAMVRVFADKA